VTNNEDNRCSVGVGWKQQGNRKNQGKMFHFEKIDHGQPIDNSRRELIAQSK
jgi:hypothetical protein